MSKLGNVKEECIYFMSAKIKNYMLANMQRWMIYISSMPNPGDSKGPT